MKCVMSVKQFEVEDTVPVGRPKKKLDEVMRTDLKIKEGRQVAHTYATLQTVIK